MNARIGNLDDTSPNIEASETLATMEHNPQSIPRLNEDHSINSHGRQLIDICKSSEIKVLNGRKFGDILGNCTCFKNNGSSQVDHILADESTMTLIQYMKVNTLTHLSDHCQLEYVLTTKIDMPELDLSEIQTQYLHCKLGCKQVWAI